MKLITFTEKGRTRMGALAGETIFDSANLENGPLSMLDYLNGGEATANSLKALIEKGTSTLTLDQVQLEAPIPNPAKFFGVGLNYADHIEETGKEKPEYPTIFNKQTSCIIGPGEAIERPRVSEKVDYEGELAFVIGKKCRHVPRDKAAGVIAGYMVANDVTVRDWQIRTPTWTLGKSFDTHGPIGPWLVTSDEVGDPHKLDIKTWVNDDLRQSSNTEHLIFDCYQLVEYISTVMTLEPGDIISTGTSSGVGVMMKPRGYLKPGETCTIEIEKLGRLTNPVVEEPEGNTLY